MCGDVLPFLNVRLVMEENTFSRASKLLRFGVQIKQLMVKIKIKYLNTACESRFKICKTNNYNNNNNIKIYIFKDFFRFLSNEVLYTG